MEDNPRFGALPTITKRSLENGGIPVMLATEPALKDARKLGKLSGMALRDKTSPFILPWSDSTGSNCVLVSKTLQAASE